MKPLDRTLVLKQTPLFEELPLETLLPIADKMEEKELDYGAKVFRCGDLIASEVYLIVAGQVEVRSGEGKLLDVLKQGELFGEEALLTNATRKYEASCTLPTTLLTLPKKQLLQTLLDCPQIALILLKAYAQGHPYRKRG